MPGERISRRQLLRDAGLGLGAGVVASTVSAAGAAAEEDAGALAGTIERIEGERAVRLRTAEGSTLVPFTDDATLWRDQPASLAEFVPGDSVTVIGDAAGSGAFAAESMVVNYFSVEAEVRERAGDVLETTGGVMRFTGNSRSHGGHELHAKPLDEVGRGDKIVALGRSDPSTEEFVALRVGVRSNGS